MGVEQKVLTTPTFINGSLMPAGSIVSVDMDQFTDEDGDPAGEDATPNLADIGEAPVLIPTEVAAIGPTGPNPTAPQQIPPGTMQTGDGYVHGGAQLVAEGHPDFAQMVEGAEALNEGVEEEEIVRLSQTAQGAGTAGSGTNGTETGSVGDAEPFSGDTFIGRNLDDISDDEIAGLTDEQRAAVVASERDREKPRVSLLRRLGVEDA